VVQGSEISEVKRMLNLTEFDKKLISVILNRNNRAYGVEIREDLEEINLKPNFFSCSFVRIYTHLERLEKYGIVRSEIGEATPERGNIPKLYFSVTEQGRKHPDLSIVNGVILRRLCGSF
jgi:PadR family transcriptional regulator PadR